MNSNLKAESPALRLLLQTQLDQVVQCGGVIFRSGALGSLGRGGGGTVEKAPSGYAFSDARVHTGA